MTWRITSTLSCLVALALAASCSSDEKGARGELPAGAGGETPSAGGDSAVPVSGRSGSASGANGGGGNAGSGNTGNGGAGRNPAGGGSHASADGGDGDGLGAGAPSGTAGDANAPTGPVSACGSGKYDAGSPGCTICPTPTAPQPTTIDCDAFASAERDGDGNLLLGFGTLAVHESFGGEVSVDWAEAGAPGSALVVWEYSFQLERFVFHLPIEARYADEITLAAWTFTDACGFSFEARSFRLYWDGVESWQCGQDA
jgi:hypothetical protein